MRESAYKSCPTSGPSLRLIGTSSYYSFAEEVHQLRYPPIGPSACNKMPCMIELYDWQCLDMPRSIGVFLGFPPHRHPPSS
jgi:hypothetical protein